MSGGCMNDESVVSEKRRIFFRKRYFINMIKRLPITIKGKVARSLLNLALSFIPESNLVKHAKEEFRFAGYDPIEKCAEDPDKWIQENVIELLKIFSFQGHSGMSAEFLIKYFKKLASFKILTPLKGTPDEWNEVGEGEFQNIRLSSVFKDKNGASYLYALSWRTDTSCWSGSATLKTSDGDRLISSRQPITFPFMPKTFYVDVHDYDDRVPNNQGFIIKDEQQLQEALDYFIGGNNVKFDK